MTRIESFIEGEAPDIDIFNKYQSAKISVLSDIKPDIFCLTKLKQTFLHDEVTDVRLTYKKNVKVDYDTPERILRELLSELSCNVNVSQSIVEQYVLVVKEKLTKIKMLRQTQALASLPDTHEAMAIFKECSEQLYGSIDAKIFCKTLQTIERDILRKSQIFKVGDGRIESASRLLNLIESYKINHSDYHSLPITLRTKKEPEAVITDAKELQFLFEKALHEYGVQSNWKVVVDKRGVRSVVSVSYSLQTIYLPSSIQLAKRSKRKKLTLTRINGLIAHEIGTHVVRKENGEKSGLLLLSTGLSGYEKGEEGLATYREQKAQSLTGYAGLEAYFALGLAYGADSGQPRNFVQVHKILTDYYLVMENTNILHAKELAWDRCLRIFRGTDGLTAGVVFAKDILYRHGNIQCWEAIERGDFKGIDLDRGKYDPTNKIHVSFLQDLKLI